MTETDGCREAFDLVLTEYVFQMVASFTGDPPDSDFQRGYEKAAREIEAWLMEKASKP